MYRKVVFILLCLVILFGCKSRYKNCPYKMEITKKRGMYMVPSFSYPGRDSLVHYTQSFFITNEITVKEFRPFLDYLRKNKDEVSLFIKQELRGRKIESINNQKLFQEIISYSPLSISDSMQNKSRDSLYYFDSEYDDLSVTGLSRNQVSFYLYWLESDTLNRKSLRQNFKKSDILTFRLMTHDEYKSLKYFIKKDDITDKEILSKNLCNLNSGAAELIVNKSQTLMAYRYDSIVEIRDNQRFPYLGFRIALKNNNFEKMEREKCSTVF